ncbi:MAG: hypothetical protein WC659_05150 [Patescibacteria group bacterium]
MKVTKPQQLYILIMVSFVIDALYYYGYLNLIDVFIDYAIGWFVLALIGFIGSYFLLYTIDIKHKAALSIVITIGVLINLGFTFFWYILKDFGF